MLLPQIDPDIDEAQRKNSERKKFMLKEVHLTKLLSTKARGGSGTTWVKPDRKAEVMPRAVLQKKNKQPYPQYCKRLDARVVSAQV